ncbi:hypothetical protein PIB30_011368 [Stylosanthes scabra]|uniref:Uncharacterized protein n=1 Tax=Stylosanthes scabra TaxID=79078 RepID=A0ABU6Y2X2_9FABA|nr:hypothetical protein [Stylosanthes scabra]
MRKRMLVREIPRKRFLLHFPCLWTSMRKKDYLRYIEELRHRLEFSPLRSRQTLVSDSPRSQLIDSLPVITLRVMISLKFGNRHGQETCVCGVRSGKSVTVWYLEFAQSTVSKIGVLHTTMIFLQRHLYEGLKNEYLTLKDLADLWRNLEERYFHQKSDDVENYAHYKKHVGYWWNYWRNLRRKLPTDFGAKLPAKIKLLKFSGNFISGFLNPLVIPPITLTLKHHTALLSSFLIEPKTLAPPRGVHGPARSR